jgi:acyl-CoA dehydrogenase
MQGLGTASISLFGSAELKARYLPPVRDGRAIAAFALSEPEAGSDVAAMATLAKPDGPAHVRIDGTKTWISNGGIADHYVLFVRTGEGAGAKGLSAFVVDAATRPAGDRAHRDRAASARFDGACACRRTWAGGRRGLRLRWRRSTRPAQRLVPRSLARRGLHETIERAATRSARRPASQMT